MRHKAVILQAMIIRIVLAVLFASLLSVAASAQQRYMQMSGMVLSSDTSRSPIPYATIFNTTLGTGTYTNMDGFYTLVVRPGDSLRVTSLGYGEVRLRVPELEGDIWIYTVLLEPRAYLLQEAIVYPWGTRDQFREAFVYMNIPDDDLERARKNLSQDEMRQLAALVQPDGPATTASVLRNYQNSYYYKGQMPSYNILSPLAWAQFFNDLKKGNYKNPNKE
jgi:hypothetical protein